MLALKKIENTPISSNCFVLFDKAVGNSSVIVDPGSEDNNRIYQIRFKTSGYRSRGCKLVIKLE